MSPNVILLNNVRTITEFEILLNLFERDEFKILLSGDSTNSFHLHLLDLALEFGIDVVKLSPDNIIESLLG